MTMLRSETGGEGLFRLSWYILLTASPCDRHWGHRSRGGGPIHPTPCSVAQVLAGTVWDGDLEGVKAERNKLYDPLSLEPPVRSAPATLGLVQTKQAGEIDTDSYVGRDGGGGRRGGCKAGQAVEHGRAVLVPIPAGRRRKGHALGSRSTSGPQAKSVTSHIELKRVYPFYI